VSKVTLEWCREQDAEDPLRDLRNRFDLPEDLIYMDGNSLGPLPKGVAERVANTINTEWRTDLIKSWNTADWIKLPSKIGAKIAPLIGASAHEVISADSTSVNLFKVAAAACKINPDRFEILSEPGNFPSDLYMMQGLTKFLGGNYKLKTANRTGIIDAITEKTAVVVLTQVHYVTADMLDMVAITKAAHDKGALIVWDLCHSVGAVPLDLNGANADFAVGCGYKYLNGGPGAPAFLFVADRHLEAVEQPLTGWMGHKAPFDFVDAYTPNDSIKRMLVGTPSVLAASAFDTALDAFSGVNMADIRHKSLGLTKLFIDLVQQELSDYSFKNATPTDSNRRGSHVSLMHNNGYAIMQALIDHKVIGDFRAPNYMRFGFTPLYLGYEDVYRAVETLAEIMETEVWQDPKYSERGSVT